ncbi:MAG: type II toxin-antitoxin system VapC family toxin [Marinoscillum sp.]|uniref:type II toxin-antitoxin system VapC family toxin n=1 Tax=Marinoscillum sp. TaxID=2024838 RepID=UPI0032F652BA
MKKTGKGYLIDTNIIIDFFRNDAGLLNRLLNTEIYIPSIVVGELIYGANLTVQRETRLREILQFIDHYRVLSVDATTSRFYGEIKAQLKQSGSPIPENDIWIAALSKQHSLILATRDRHFEKAKSIEVEYW